MKLMKPVQMSKFCPFFPHTLKGILVKALPSKWSVELGYWIGLIAEEGTP